VRPDQYERVAAAGLNMSGLIRGLLDDHLGEAKIVLSVSPAVREVYRSVVSNFGGEDSELERYFLEALDSYLEAKTKEIETLRRSIKKD